MKLVSHETANLEIQLAAQRFDEFVESGSSESRVIGYKFEV